jgi:acetyl esterase/lipase
VNKGKTIQIPAFALPESSFLRKEGRVPLKHARFLNDEWAAAYEACPPIEGASRADIPEIRRCQAEEFYKTFTYKRVRDRYDVSLIAEEIGGVYTEVFTPAEGVAPDNKDCVLINVHGGGFYTGSRTFSHFESVPIASVGKIKVISIDYRMAPEYNFPAASEDVAAVYRELLKTFEPTNIGIYGCSAGGVLTAQAVAWFQKEGLPPPGAVGMFCAAGSYFLEGDSGYFGAALMGMPLGAPYTADPPFTYFKNADPNNPLVFPTQSPQVMAKFPPSLLITSTRDIALSSVVHTHSILVQQGADADLHVWEGLEHAFYFDPDLPQSREVHEITIKFFARHLGRQNLSATGSSFPAST